MRRRREKKIEKEDEGIRRKRRLRQISEKEIERENVKERVRESVRESVRENEGIRRWLRRR